MCVRSDEVQLSMINIINFISIVHAPYASNLNFPFMSENKTPINKRKTKKKGCYFFKNNTLTTTSVALLHLLKALSTLYHISMSMITAL